MHRLPRDTRTLLQHVIHRVQKATQKAAVSLSHTPSCGSELILQLSRLLRELQGRGGREQTTR